jgi:hypothetical protein
MTGKKLIIDVEGIQLRGDPPTVNGAEVNLRGHHCDPLSQTSH